jgi:AcrR family transcriptional regulator
MLNLMSHREDLLAGAVRCLREKGYARTTARDIVAASGTNLASIGYHYGSTQALMNAAVIQAMDEFGTQIAQAIGYGPGGTGPDAEATMIERFERFWAHAIGSFQADAEVWMATFDAFSVAQRNPEVRTALADGIEDGRLLWAKALYGPDPLDGPDALDAGPGATRAIGSVFQALISGVLVQWLLDPARAPSAAELATALSAIGARLAAENAGHAGNAKLEV